LSKNTLQSKIYNLESTMVVNLSDQYSLLSDWIGELRDEDVQKDRMRFRKNLERIGEVAAIEISKELPYAEKEIQTPLGTATCRVLKEQPVLGTILRAGVPLHQPAGPQRRLLGRGAVIL